MSTEYPSVDVSQWIESRQRFGAGRWWLVFLCLLVVTFDGFDAQIMGYAAPALVKDWHVDRTLLGPVISAGLFGLMLGALVLGTLGDRIGRKTIILISVAVFSVGSLLTAFVTNVGQLSTLRFLTGVGLGGAMPGAVALVSEYVPARLRGTMVTITVCGFAIGPAVGGFIAGGLIRVYGWPALFVVGGVVPLVMLPVLWRLLPESSRFLIGRGAPAPEIVENLRRVFPRDEFAPNARYVHAEGRVPKAPVRELFAEGRGTGTMLLWLALFLNLVGINLQTSWLPMLLSDLGYSVAQAVSATAMLHVGGALGGLVLSRLLDRYDAPSAVAAIGMIAGLTIILVGASGGSLTLLRCSIFLAGLFVVGAQSALNALSAMFYPGPIRSTGSGWALGVGRLGAAAGPTIGSALVALKLDMRTLYYVESLPFFLMGATMLALRFTRKSAMSALAEQGPTHDAQHAGEASPMRIRAQSER